MTMTTKQLNAINGLKAIISKTGVTGLRVELIGSWYWLFGNTDGIEKDLRAAGFVYNEYKGGWYVKDDNKSAGNGRTTVNYLHSRYPTIIMDDNKR